MNTSFIFDARQALQRSPHFSLRRLKLENRTDALVVTGKVPSYFLKQMAQETLRPMCAGLQIVNEVDVVACGSMAF